MSSEQHLDEVKDNYEDPPNLYYILQQKELANANHVPGENKWKKNAFGESEIASNREWLDVFVNEDVLVEKSHWIRFLFVVHSGPSQWKIHQGRVRDNQKGSGRILLPQRGKYSTAL